MSLLTHASEWEQYDVAKPAVNSAKRRTYREKSVPVPTQNTTPPPNTKAASVPASVPASMAARSPVEMPKEKEWTAWSAAEKEKVSPAASGPVRLSPMYLSEVDPPKARWAGETWPKGRDVAEESEPYYKRDKLSYIVSMLEDIRHERTSTKEEEVILYCLVGVFVIYMMDVMRGRGRGF